MLRFIFGLFVIIGAVGTLEADPDASLWVYGWVAIAGVVFMIWPIADQTLLDDDLK
jgi:hypothetical protein